MTLEQLAGTLPNGFHDTEISAIHVDYANRRVTIEAAVWIGDMDEREAPTEAYRNAEVVLDGLHFLSMEPPDPRESYAKDDLLRVDLTDGPKPGRVPAADKMPAGCFAAGFFVMNRNAFVWVVAREASMRWRGELYDRG